MRGKTTSDYDDFADTYSTYSDRRERGGIAGDPFGILPGLFGLLGEIAGKSVLDADCGDGYLARLLHARGAA